MRPVTLAIGGSGGRPFARASLLYVRVHTTHSQVKPCALSRDTDGPAVEVSRHIVAV